MNRRLIGAWIVAFLSLSSAARGFQTPTGATPNAGVEEKEPSTTQPVSPPARTVHVNPMVRDDEIRRRLAHILERTKQYDNLKVEVEDGVVVLSGEAKSEEDKKWAGDLTRNTQDVVAVMNRINVTEPSIWNFRPALNTLNEMQRGVIGSLPFIFSGIIILILASFASKLVTGWMRAAFSRRIASSLLREVAARAAGFLVLLVGFYTALRVVNLTSMALTVVGGTGLLGLVLGIAFRDISENFLASLFLSAQRPFQIGDLIQVADVTGYVQRLTIRTTVVMSLDGNEVQIPNATVYSSVIHNFTSSPNRRVDFPVNIAEGVAIGDAQRIVLEVLERHSAVLRDPPPAVLVDSLGDTSVTLRIYFWINGRENSWLKVRSSLMRLVKEALQGLTQTSKGDGRARNVDGRNSRSNTGNGKTPAKPGAGRKADVVNPAEGNLQTEAHHIEEQARSAETRRW